MPRNSWCLRTVCCRKIADRLKNKIEELKQKGLETLKAAREGDVQKYGLANIEFHRLIVEATENQTLIRVWESLATEIRALTSVYVNAINLIQAAEDHLEIVEAFAEGDNRYAGKLLKVHTETVLIHSKA